MKKRLFKGHKQIREKELENGKLDEYVQDLAVSVAQREKIIRVRESDKNLVDENEYRMQVCVCACVRVVSVCLSVCLECVPVCPLKNVCVLFFWGGLALSSCICAASEAL